jgi:geranylgeranyl pyrophosphate synthase
VFDRRSFREFAEAARASVDAALERFLPQPPGCPELLSQAMRYSLSAGGKRLRPLLVIAAAEAVQRGSRTVVAPTTPTSARHADLERLVLPAACAVEMIHTYSLVHDDLPAMDNDTLRRGRPTLHVAFGDAVAVLAGDALQAEAFALLAREPVSADPVVAARKLQAIGRIAVAAGACGMVGGQVVDIQASGQAPGHAIALGPDSLRAMHLQKTGALISASAAAGAIMAGGDVRAVAAVDAWASEVGLAFQIVDDILDIEGTAEDLGKTAGKDAAGAKPTYASLFGVARSRAMAADCTMRSRAVLVEAGLEDGWLNDIADWILARRA